MNADLNVNVGKIIDAINSAVNSGKYDTVIKTGAGIIEKQGDGNYVKAVLIAEALYKALGARPVIRDMGNSYYVVTWEGAEQEKATQYLKNMAVKFIDSDKSPEPVSVDFTPIIKPLGVKYGLPVIVGAGLACFLLGFTMGK